MYVLQLWQGHSLLLKWRILNKLIANCIIFQSLFLIISFMKKWVSILLVLGVHFSYAQLWSSDFSKVDWHAQSVPNAAPDSLAKMLTAPYQSDLLKVRAIFRWIAEHISYRTRINYRNAFANRYKTVEYDDADTVYKSLNRRIAESVLSEGEAVCDGYSRLFKILCDEAGIRSEIVTGYARTNMSRPGTPFRSNHNWNAVMIDSNWHLVDVTWASGYIGFTNDFVKAFDEFYFLTPPQDFIRDHYPEDLFWTLLHNPPTLREFNRMPFRYTGFIKRRILSYKPSTGVIEASVGDSLVFEMETDEEEKKLWVSDSAYMDTAEVSVFEHLPRPLNKVKGKTVSYTYAVPSEAVQWLYVIYNDELVMRYRLEVKKPYASAKPVE